jgi:hypothetical protein
MAEETEESPTGGGGQLGVMESMEQLLVDALDRAADDLDLTELTGESEASDAVLAFENAALPTEGWGESEVIVSAVIDADLAESVRADDGAVSASDALAESLPEEVIEPMPVTCADTQLQPVKPVKASEFVAATHRQANGVSGSASSPEQSAEADLVEPVVLVSPGLIAPMPVPVAQDSPPQWINATSAEKTRPAQALSETAPTQLQIEQAEQITWLLKTSLRRFGFALLLGGLLLGGLHADWDFAEISRKSEALYGPLGAGKGRIDAWQRLMATQSQGSEMQRLQVVNQFFNQQLRYVEDIWHRYDAGWNPNGAICKYWYALLRAGGAPGFPMEREHPTENGRYIIQGFSNGFLTYNVATGVVTETLPPLS